MRAIDWSDPEVRREWDRAMRVFVSAPGDKKQVALAQHLRRVAQEKPRIVELFCQGDAELRALVFGEPQPDGPRKQLPLPGLEQRKGR